MWTRALALALHALALAEALRTPAPTRREAVRLSLCSGVASLCSGVGASAYDSMPSGVPSAKATGRAGGQLNYNDVFEKGKYGAPPVAMSQSMDPDAMRAERMKKKAEREKKAKAKNAEADELIAKIAAAADTKDADEFAKAVDTLSLWIIEQGPPLPPPGGPWADILGSSPLPEGFETRELVRATKDALASLPRIGYACEKTRDNNGVCFSAGPVAEGAYKAMLVELKKRAPLQYDTPYGPVNF